MTLNQQITTLLESKGWKYSKPRFGHDGKWHVPFSQHLFDWDSTWAGEPPPLSECIVDQNNVPDIGDDRQDCWDTFEHDADEDYWVELVVICGNSWSALKATPAQRIEAYLRFKGLWKD